MNAYIDKRFELACFRALLAASFVLGIPCLTLADETIAPLSNGQPRGLPLDEQGDEKWSGGWTFAVDNDMLGPKGSDFDYTGGAAVTFAGRRTKEWFWSLDPAADWAEGLFFDTDGTFALHAQQVGVIAFTPDDLEALDPVVGDRPYASLLFLSNSKTRIRGPLDPVDTTTVTVGVLGLNVAGEIQTWIHEERDLDEIPRGWDHQISDGGEPTARISWSRQSILRSNFQSNVTEYELKWGRELSLGYQTEATLSISGRWGRINTPWWSFTPDRAEYVSQPAPVIGTAFRENVKELYVWAGLKLRARAYNAFLQGQFRSSDYELDAGDIEPVIGEAWLGVTWQVSKRWRLSYSMRHQTAEMKRGEGNRSLTWGGFIVAYDL